MQVRSQNSTDKLIARSMCFIKHLRIVSTPAYRHDAGTGNFSAAFHRLCGLTHKLLCVDPYESLLAQARAHPEGGFASTPPPCVRLITIGV